MKRIVQKLRNLVKKTLEYLDFIRWMFRDMGRYLRWALIGWRNHSKTRSNIESQIIKYYHTIEKGLSMPDFRPKFGQGNIKGLVYFLQEHVKQGGGRENVHFQSALLVLREYVSRHKDMRIDISDYLSGDELCLISPNSNEVRAEVRGGSGSGTSNEYFSMFNACFADFCRSRKSCREFIADRKISKEVLDQAVDIAKSTPSVCNRQSWKVHSYHDRDRIDSLLAFQNGNRGFGHLAPCLLVVTVDLQTFDGPIERNQPWIDGGMFSMTLLFGLHHLKVGAVPLNWCVGSSTDLNFRAKAGIPDSEAIIMLVAAGYPPEQIRFPVSQRRANAEIHSLHGDSRSG
ncbi:nitroreductase family protein [Haloferula sp.]|uniref:nitroreductase family protein n=1 Tax=Haloferula sp. TaxID=2497595 RepID=UPI0032A02E87